MKFLSLLLTVSAFTNACNSVVENTSSVDGTSLTSSATASGETDDSARKKKSSPTPTPTATPVATPTATPISTSLSAPNVGYLMTATLVPASSKLQLQTLLNQYGTIRLAPGADYRTGGIALLTVSSNQKIYSLPNTLVPPILIAKATTQATLSGVTSPSITFAPSALASDHIHGNLFLRIQAPAVAAGATIENNLIVDWNGQLSLDDSVSGYIRNNRFIRTVEQGNANTMYSSQPQITLKGNATTASYGNIFLWRNFLTPTGDGALISGQTSTTFIGVDAESWNFSKTSSLHALFTVTSDVNQFKIFIANGGQLIYNLNDPNATSYFNVNSRQFLVYNDISSSSQTPKTLLGSNVQFATLLDSTYNTQVDNVLQTSSANTAIRTNGSSLFASGSLLTNDSSDYAQTPWAAPTYEVVPDPAGANWNSNLAAKTDSTTYLQGLINQGISFLPAGTYYISSPLVLKAGQGLVGAGMGNTTIIAKSTAIDIFTTQVTAQNFTLSDLTLQGGANGIHFLPSSSTNAIDISFIFLSHVTFRNMANAGIFTDQIFGFDNNLLDHLNFINNHYGVLQAVNQADSGGNGGAFWDKNVFYHCQFIGNQVGISFPAVRADNLNLWADTLFQNNADGAIALDNNYSDIVANSDFVNNGGVGVISNSAGGMNVVNSRFVAGALGVAFLDGDISIEGSQFSQGGGNATILSGVVPGSANALSFYNSSSTDVSIGNYYKGLYVNNRFTLNPELNHANIFEDMPTVTFYTLSNGVKTVIESGKLDYQGTTGGKLFIDIDAYQNANQIVAGVYLSYGTTTLQLTSGVKAVSWSSGTQTRITGIASAPLVGPLSLVDSATVTTTPTSQLLVGPALEQTY